MCLRACGAWLFSIANNHCVDRLRRRPRAQAKSAALPELDRANDIYTPWAARQEKTLAT